MKKKEYLYFRLVDNLILSLNAPPPLENASVKSPIKKGLKVAIHQNTNICRTFPLSLSHSEQAFDPANLIMAKHLNLVHILYNKYR